MRRLSGRLVLKYESVSRRLSGFPFPYLHDGLDSRTGVRGDLYAGLLRLQCRPQAQYRGRLDENRTTPPRAGTPREELVEAMRAIATTGVAPAVKRRLLAAQCSGRTNRARACALILNWPDERLGCWRSLFQRRMWAYGVVRFWSKLTVFAPHSGHRTLRCARSSRRPCLAWVPLDADKGSHSTPIEAYDHSAPI